MKAAIRKKYGPPSTIAVEEVETLVLKAGEVLVKVHATTVNRTDCANLTGKPFIMHFVLGLFKPSKSILGTDFAGEVAALADDVKIFSKGDGVFGFIDTGAESQANYTKVKADQLFLIPENVGFKEAAASLEGAHYAYSFVHKVQIKTGQKVLINGATGGIGSALLQFVRQYDVHITVTCNDKNRELMKSLGADQLIDFNQQDFTELDQTYDYVFDAVGKSTFGKSKKVLTSDGTYISSELGPYAQNVFYAMFSFLFRRKVIFPIPFSTEQTIPFISNALANNTFKPVIEKEYDLAEISAAYQYVISGQKTGNVLIKYDKQQ